MHIQILPNAVTPMNCHIWAKIWAGSRSPSAGADRRGGGSNKPGKVSRTSELDRCLGMAPVFPRKTRNMMTNLAQYADGTVGIRGPAAVQNTPWRIIQRIRFQPQNDMRAHRHRALLLCRWKSGVLPPPRTKNCAHDHRKHSTTICALRRRGIGWRR